MAATTVEAIIEEALNARLAALTLSPARPVAWPGVGFTPAPGAIYLEPRFLPNTAAQITLGDSGLNRHFGLYQVSVYGPAAGSHIALREIAGLVGAHFRRGLSLTRSGLTVRIDRPPSTGPSLTESALTMIPVTVSWFCDAANPA
ncbi:DUF4128 domain-containing protein [Salinarimonas sp. NSM]|uniref:DUF4128 domain-containing protein n=1 Tax=Salinarimonas sp. NSM TaxID=3458003 RepID=UPI00403673A9